MHFQAKRQLYDKWAFCPVFFKDFVKKYFERIWWTLPMAASEWYDFARKIKRNLKKKPKILITNWVTLSQIWIFLIIPYRWKENFKQNTYFLVVKSTANISADSEQILGQNIEVNKSPVELEFQINRFIQKTHMCFLKGCLGSKIYFAYGLTMMK